MKGAELLVRCLENERVERIFGIPGEENIHVMDVLLDSPIEFVTTRHEQGAAFMADVFGRLTGKAGVCLATLGPGATNLVTGVADANMDHAPVVAIAGQGATTRLHKESHQILDLVRLFEPISKYSVQIRAPEIIPEVIRKAFKLAEAEKPGCSFISFPENIAAMDMPDKDALPVRSTAPPLPPADKIAQAAKLISSARYPIIIAGNGVLRAKSSSALQNSAEVLNIPVANTFMAKGRFAFLAHDCPWARWVCRQVITCPVVSTGPMSSYVSAMTSSNTIRACGITIHQAGLFISMPCRQRLMNTILLMSKSWVK